MGPFCILCGQSRAENSSIHLYSVPKDDDKRKQWIDAVGKNLPARSSVCSKHFPLHCVGRLKLLKGALPTSKPEVLENEKTDGSTLKLENEGWTRVSSSFNSPEFSSLSGKHKFLDDPLMDYGAAAAPNSDVEVDSRDSTAVYGPKDGVYTTEPEIIVIEEEIEPKGRKRKNEEENNEQNLITKLKNEIENQQEINAMRMRAAEIDKRTAEIKRKTAEIKKRTAEMEHKLAVLKVKEQLNKMYPELEYNDIDVEELDISSL